MRMFSLSVSEPWDFESPDGTNLVRVEHIGIVGGPNKENWASHYLLLKAVNPFQMKGESVEFLIASPRYTGDSLESVISTGGIVGVSRVRPAATVLANTNFEVKDVDYCIMGRLSPSHLTQEDGV